MKLLETFVYISAKDDALKMGLKSASKYARIEMGKMQRMLDSLSFKGISFQSFAIGAGALYSVKKAFDSLIGSTVKAGDEFHAMRGRTGMAVKELSAWAYVAGQTETNMEAVEITLKRLSKNMYETSLGMGLSRKAFQELGISVVEPSGKLKSMTAMVMELSSKIGGMTDPTKQVAYAMTLMGRSGANMLPILKAGPPAIKAMMEEARRLGLVMSNEDAAAADDLNDSLASMKGAVDGVKRAIATGIIPVLTEYVKMAREWVVSHREIIRVKVTEWITGIGSALKRLYDMRNTIKTVFEVALITLAATKLIILAGAITKVASALALLGASGGAKVLMDLMAKGALGTAILTLATPAGLAVLGTLAAGGSVAMGIKLIRDHLREIDGYKYSGMTQFTKTVEPISAEAAIAAAKPKRMTYEQAQEIGYVMTLTGQKPVDEVRAAFDAAEEEKSRNKPEYKMPEMKKFFPLPPVLESRAWEFEKPTYGMNAPNWTELAQENRDEDLKAMKVYQEQRAGLEKSISDQTIRNTMTGFEQNRAIEMTRYNEEIKEYGNNSALLELSAQKHWLNMTAIAQAEQEKMKQESLDFATYWGDMLISVVEQAGNSFNNIGRMFEQMLKKMAIKAAVYGFLNMLTGGTFGAGVQAALRIPGMASGGLVQKPTLALIGERGPERVLNPAQTRAYDRAGTGKSVEYHDNSTLNFNFSGDVSKMDRAELTNEIDRIVRDRKSKEIEKLRKVVNG